MAASQFKSSYNFNMDSAVLNEMKQYLGFSEADVANLIALRDFARPLIPEVVQRFYAELQRHPSAREVFRGGEEQMARLRRLLGQWMSELFDGDYGVEYLEKRYRIGFTHVRVNLPQRFMFLGMEVVRRELWALLRAAGVPDIEAKLESLQHLLVLDLAIMVDSYKLGYTEHVRQIERMAMEERLDRAEQLAEIGQLAASLAHEIKNPLAGISGAIQVIGDQMQPDDPHRAIIHEILRQINRLDATVKDLLQYARPRPPRLTVVSLKTIVERALKVLMGEPALNGRVLNYTSDGDDVCVEADDGQIEQVLLNLVLNAADASREGQTIEVIVNGDDQLARLRVRDSGRGMTPEVLARALEPFYTTKARGTGLGLSICQRIIQRHHGMLRLESKVGQGTTVTVELPRAGRQPDVQDV